MIVDLPDTTTSDVSARLVRIREEVGAMALTRVLTLVIVVDESGVESAIDTANEASHVHPCRIIVVALGNPRGSTRLDGQLYTVVGEQVPGGRWQLRLWWKPFVTLIWAGGALIALGGALSLLGRTLPRRRPKIEQDGYARAY